MSSMHFLICLVTLKNRQTHGRQIAELRQPAQLACHGGHFGSDALIAFHQRFGRARHNFDDLPDFALVFVLILPRQVGPARQLELSPFGGILPMPPARRDC